MIFKRKKEMIDLTESKSPKIPENKKEKKEYSSLDFVDLRKIKKSDLVEKNTSQKEEFYNKREVDSKIFDLDNKIYKLEQRIELLERKLNVGSNSPTGLIDW